MEGLPLGNPSSFRDAGRLAKQKDRTHGTTLPPPAGPRRNAGQTDGGGVRQRRRALVGTAALISEMEDNSVYFPRAQKGVRNKIVITEYGANKCVPTSNFLSRHTRDHNCQPSNYPAQPSSPLRNSKWRTGSFTGTGLQCATPTIRASSASKYPVIHRPPEG